MLSTTGGRSQFNFTKKSTGIIHHKCYETLLFFFCFFLCAICVCTHIRCLPQSFSTLFIKAISCWTQSSPVPDSVARLLQRYSPCLSSAGITGSHYTYPDSFFHGHWDLNPKPSTFKLSYLPGPQLYSHKSDEPEEEIAISSIYDYCLIDETE